VPFQTSVPREILQWHITTLIVLSTVLVYVGLEVSAIAALRFSSENFFHSMASSIGNQQIGTTQSGLPSQIGDVLIRHDQIFLDQVGHASWERTQKLHHDIIILLSDQQPNIAAEFQKKIQQLEGDKWKLQVSLGNLERENAKLRATIGAVDEEMQDLHVGLKDLGLRLAQAYKFRQGSKEEIRSQFRMKGVHNPTTERLMSSTAFLDEVAELLGPRRSERLGSKTSKSPVTEISQ